MYNIKLSSYFQHIFLHFNEIFEIFLLCCHKSSDSITQLSIFDSINLLDIWKIKYINTKNSSKCCFWLKLNLTCDADAVDTLNKLFLKYQVNNKYRDNEH